MRYSDTYLMNHDIDWFCIVNGVYVHVASAGGKIPNQINDDERLRKIQYQVELLEDIYSDEEIEYNEVAIAEVIENEAKGREQYIESFAAMARKGFVSFDRTNIAEFGENQYHWVCKSRLMECKPEGLDLYSENTDNESCIGRMLGLNNLMSVIMRDDNHRFRL